MPPSPRARVPSIDAELAAWVNGEADHRVCHPRVLIEAGLRLLRDACERAPERVDLPCPPRGAVRHLGALRGVPGDGTAK